jgi:F0F1-type ATP synthase assembly protein I
MVLLAGPLIGFLLGAALDRRMNSDPWGQTILACLGFIASVKQTVEMIRELGSDKNRESQ